MNKLKVGLVALALAVPLSAGAVDTTYQVADLDARASFDNRIILNGTMGDLQIVNMPNFTNNGTCTGGPDLDTAEMARDINERISGTSAKFGELATRIECGGSESDDRKWIIKTGSGAMNADSVTISITLANSIGTGNIKAELYSKGQSVSSYNCSGGQTSSTCEFSDSLTATITLKSSTGIFDEIRFSGDSGNFNNDSFYEDVTGLKINVDDHVTDIGYDGAS